MIQTLAVEANFPERIICMTEETTEWFYLLGEQHRIVGVSGYTVRPPEARKEKPKISAFTSAKIDKILALEPDLVIGFSDMQADIAAELIRAGVNVHICNQRSVQEIFDTLLQLGCLIGAEQQAREILQQFTDKLTGIQQMASTFSRRPKVYFEEWGDPLISGIRWVSELIEIAGGDDCFSELAKFPGAKNRIIEEASEVVQRNPDIIIGSWCGRKFAADQVADRPGWGDITAIKTGQLHEIKSSDILQPGPAALTDGIAQLHRIFSDWVSAQ